MGDDFVFDWTKKLGFKRNPFEPEIPKKINKFFAGRGEERKKLNLFVLEKYPFGTISGEEGLGKTTILKWMDSQLSKATNQVKVAYINASDLEKERDLIKGLTMPLMNVLEKTMQKKQEKLRLEETGKFIYDKLKGGQRLLILLDDVGGLPDRYVSLFKYFFKNKIGVQLIAAGTEKELQSSGITTVAEKDWLGIKLSSLDYEEMKSLLEKRIRNYGQDKIFPFQEDMLEELYDESDGNPKRFLEMAREKAIKLSLDRDYINQELKKIEEERRKMQESGEGGGVISIRLGGGDDDEESYREPGEEGDELLELLEAPEMEEQEKMLEEAKEEEKHEKEEEKDKKEEAPSLDLEFEDEPEEDKKKKKDKESADETEELLSQLTKEFDED